MKQNHQINLVASFKTPENQRKANVIIKNSLYFGFCLAGEKKKKKKEKIISMMFITRQASHQDPSDILFNCWE